MYTVEELKEKALSLRRMTVRMCCKAGMGHIAPAFSCIEILTALYYGGLIKYDAVNPAWSERDYFVLSKGQACAPLYALLADLGFFNKSLLDGYCHNFSPLGGHAESDIAGVEAFTGSLGMGITHAVGIALGLKIANKPNHVYALLGDGETQEGSVWEAFDLAAVNELSNLTILIDWNKQQATDLTMRTTKIDPTLYQAINSRGLGICVTEGHNITNLIGVIKNMKAKQALANCAGVVLCSTIKGKGVKEIEGVCEWHYRIPVTEIEKQWFANYIELA